MFINKCKDVKKTTKKYNTMTQVASFSVVDYPSYCESSEQTSCFFGLVYELDMSMVDQMRVNMVKGIGNSATVHWPLEYTVYRMVAILRKQSMLSKVHKASINNF